jgi:hypothetical protein
LTHGPVTCHDGPDRLSNCLQNAVALLLLQAVVARFVLQKREPRAVKKSTGASWRRRIWILAGVITLAAPTACVGGSLLGPRGPVDTQGHVTDDGGLVPGGRTIGLAGVRVEALDGQKAGTFALTDREGTYRMPNLGIGPVTVRATKDGFQSETEAFYPEYPGGPIIMLGQPPHTLWGDVALARTTPSVFVSDVRVEILDGPNAGKVAISDERGRYRFDDLVTSPPFLARLSRVGHQTRTYSMTELRHNDQRNLQIEAE